MEEDQVEEDQVEEDQMEEEDQLNETEEDAASGSYGAGSASSSRKKSKGKGKAKEPQQPVGLTPSDEHYPTDLPEGAPTDFDWCTYPNVVRKVVNQGNRRTCWTFATNRSFSGRLVAEKKFTEVNLSSLHMLAGLVDELGDKGGLKKKDFTLLKNFMIDNGTVAEEDCACPQNVLENKETKKDGPVLCTDKGNKSKHIREFKVKDLVILDKVNETQLISLVLEGPVAVCIDVHQEFLRFEGDGVYMGPSTKTRPKDNHLFLVVGYGTRRKDGLHYWKVQNSGGTKWGKDGFGKICRQVSLKRGAPSLFTAILYPKLLDNYEGQLQI